MGGITPLQGVGLWDHVSNTNYLSMFCTCIETPKTGLNETRWQYFNHKHMKYVLPSLYKLLGGSQGHSIQELQPAASHSWDGT